MIKRFNICTKREYTDNRTGEKKNQWMTIGTMIYFPENGDKQEGYKIELSMFPTTSFSVFEQKQRENGDATVNNETGQVARPRPNKSLPPVVPRGSKVEPGQIEYPEEEINPDDIPF